MAKHIVVTGATGNIGTQAVHILLQKGHRVTAVARASERLNALQQAGAEIQAGDLSDSELLTKVFREADSAFLMIPPNLAAPDVIAHQQQVGESIARAVRASGLRQAVHLSSVGADQSSGNGPVRGLFYQEARLNAIDGLRVAHLRPAYFFENLLANISLIQGMGITGSATRPDLSFPMIATKDIAAKAAALLDQDNFAAGSVHMLLGPRNYTMQEAAAAIGQAIGKPDLPYVQFPYDQARQGMMQAGLSESMAALYDEMTRSMNEEKVLVHETRTPENTTPTTLEEFAQTVFAPILQHAAQHAS